jgi:chorismate synthase
MQRGHGLIRRESDLFEIVSGARDGDTNERPIERAKGAHTLD